MAWIRNFVCFLGHGLNSGLKVYQFRCCFPNFNKKYFVFYSEYVLSYWLFIHWRNVQQMSMILIPDQYIIQIPTVYGLSEAWSNRPSCFVKFCFFTDKLNIPTWGLLRSGAGLFLCSKWVRMGEPGGFGGAAWLTTTLGGWSEAEPINRKGRGFCRTLIPS